MRTVVVTGVSTGIGNAVAIALVRRGFRVFGSVRRLADGDELRDVLGEAFVSIVLDLRDPSSIDDARDVIAGRLAGASLGGLVNNAGIAQLGPLLEQPMSDIRAHLEINVLGTLQVIRAFTPLLMRKGDDPPGRLIIMSSTSGRLSLPFFGAYVASKHAVEGLAGSLRKELLPFDIPVVVVRPGATATPVWDKSEAAVRTIERSSIYGDALATLSRKVLAIGRSGYPARKVADVVADALTVAKPKPFYHPIKFKLARWDLPLSLPTGTLDRMMWDFATKP